MRIIGITASPRKAGNTAFAVNQILEGAKEQGAEIKHFYFSDIAIEPCKGCLCCHQGDGGCVIEDDMQMIYEVLEQADVLVLGSPIYMGQMSAQAKIFTDRLFAQITPRFSPHFKEKNAGKKLILVFTQGNPDANMFKAYCEYTKYMFELLEFEVKDLQIIADMRSSLACEQRGLHASLKGIGLSL